MKFRKSAETRYRESFFKDLDGIYKMSKVVCKNWQTELITIENLGIIIKESETKVTSLDGKAKEAGNAMQDAFNKTKQSLLKHCEQIAKKNNTNGVPLGVLLSAINQIKQGFKKGAKTK